jgi:hypothetical protein
MKPQSVNIIDRSFIDGLAGITSACHLKKTSPHPSFFITFGRFGKTPDSVAHFNHRF